MPESSGAVLPASRSWVAGRAHGRALEIGVGAWPSLQFYSPAVVVTGLDRQPKAVARASRTAARVGRKATVVEGDAMALPFADASFDSVVFSFSLCGVPSVHGALVEGLRVLVPGGTLLMADHVISTSGPLRAVQRVAEAFTRPTVGEHFTRRPSLAARELDVDVVAIERLSRGAIERLHAVKRG